MGTNLCSVEEDYIDMELTSKTRDFEFSTFHHREETSTFPADELFYKGKLLPLHLPPRRQMVEHLLCTTTTISAAAAVDRYFSAPFTAPCTTANTPSDSRNISPSESCRASCDLNPSDANFFEWPNELTNFIANHNHKGSINPWMKKIKQIKHSIVAQRLKSSRAYLRSLFTKSVPSSDEKSPVPTLSMKMGKKIADIIKSIDRNAIDDRNGNRRSFSGAIKRHSPTKCLSSSSSSSSSSSFNSSGVRVNFLRRNSSANEIEGSINAAIAHCKKSMQDSKIEEKIGVSMFEFES